MKIAVYTDPRVLPSFGGGFSYLSRLIERLEDFSSTSEHEYCLLFSESQESVPDIRPSKLEMIYTGQDRAVALPTWKRKFLNMLAHNRPLLRIPLDDIQKSYRERKKCEVARDVIRRNKIDLVYYPHQQRCISPDVPFVATNWDLAHIVLPSFPELSGAEYVRRDHWYREILPRAMCIFVESEAGRQELVKYLQIPEEKIKVVPIFPGRVVDLMLTEEEESSRLKDLNLEPCKYYFYPAQFWAVKNHYGLLQAFNRIPREFGSELKLVLPGADQGNLSYVRQVCRELGLESQVLFPGFIEDEDLWVLYKNAIALVMPTFLGPTNMPILEALSLGCPVICSDFDGHRELAGNAPLYIDPSNQDEIFDAMKRILIDADFRNGMKIRGFDVSESSPFNIDETIVRVDRYLTELSVFRKCWGV